MLNGLADKELELREIEDRFPAMSYAQVLSLYGFDAEGKLIYIHNSGMIS